MCNVLLTSDDPTRRPRRGARTVWLLGGPFVALCGTWAFWPVEARQPVAEGALPQARAEPAPQPTDSIDPRVFEVALWNRAPVPVPVGRKTDARPEPPVVLELVAIIEEGGARQAALYDRQAGELLVVAAGQTIGAFTVTAIEPGYVEISDGPRVVRLSLEEEPP